MSKWDVITWPTQIHMHTCSYSKMYIYKHFKKFFSYLKVKSGLQFSNSILFNFPLNSMKETCAWLKLVRGRSYNIVSSYTSQVHLINVNMYWIRNFGCNLCTFVWNDWNDTAHMKNTWYIEHSIFWTFLKYQVFQ